MSLPLTRRIARAALLVAAAAPVIGAAGAASAAALPSTPALGGLSTIDGANLGNAVDGASQKATNVAGDAGSKAASSPPDRPRTARA
ncbi:hypothetical protein ACFU99_37655, partial [Streptomyces sp. NPDC057654]